LLTESISQALRLSGASATEAQSSLLQFGQALASGVLRGEEFNSVVENSPRLAQALADGLNVPIGRLRKLAEEGRLTADVVVNAPTRTRQQRRPPPAPATRLRRRWRRPRPGSTSSASSSVRASSSR
jgi:tape measure domain-containing protein